MGVIYQFTNKVNGKKYIGYSVDFKTRLSKHWKDAEKGEGFALHAAIRKYGKSNFTVEVIAESFQECLPALEIMFIALYGTLLSQHGYNMTPGGEGVPCTDAIRAKMSASSKNRPPLTPEQRATMSASQKGKIISLEQRQKHSATLTGRTLPRSQVERMVASNAGKKRSDAVKQNMSDLAPKGEDHHMWGKNHKEESKAKQSASLLKHYETNSKPPTTDETRALMSAAKKNDPEMMTRMRKLGDSKIGKPAANKGSTHTPETKAKMKAYWAARREAKLSKAA
jgi:group I intron endonuclease